MISRWMDSESLTMPSCWWSLVQAAKDMDENVIAQTIKTDHSKCFIPVINIHDYQWLPQQMLEHDAYLIVSFVDAGSKFLLFNACTQQHPSFSGEAVEVQENLLDPAMFNLKPSDSFLQVFAKIVSTNWPHLASQLSLSTRDIMEELKRRGRSSAPADQPLFMLQKWKTKEEATYGLLCERLRTVLLVQ